MGLCRLNKGYNFQVGEGGGLTIQVRVVAKKLKHILVHNLATRQPTKTGIVPFETTQQDLSNKGGPGAIGYQHK